jgi:hypothetical protein
MRNGPIARWQHRHPRCRVGLRLPGPERRTASGWALHRGQTRNIRGEGDRRRLLRRFREGGAPRTAEWEEGAEVRGNPHIPRGTPIATFEPDGSYTSKSGNHAAIYLDQDDHGIWVYDQWHGQPAHKRLIRFECGSGSKWGSKSNDSRRLAVIE